MILIVFMWISRKGYDKLFNLSAEPRRKNCFDPFGELINETFTLQRTFLPARNNLISHTHTLKIWVHIVRWKLHKVMPVTHLTEFVHNADGQILKPGRGPDPPHSGVHLLHRSHVACGNDERWLRRTWRQPTDVIKPVHLVQHWRCMISMLPERYKKRSDVSACIRERAKSTTNSDA